jgi:hypothetical protein
LLRLRQLLQLLLLLHWLLHLRLHLRLLLHLRLILLHLRLSLLLNWLQRRQHLLHMLHLLHGLHMLHMGPILSHLAFCPAYGCGRLVLGCAGLDGQCDVGGFEVRLDIWRVKLRLVHVADWLSALLVVDNLLMASCSQLLPTMLQASYSVGLELNLSLHSSQAILLLLGIMGYFDEYDLDSRFKSTRSTWNPVHGHYHVVMDWDQRRIISVCTSEEKDDEFVYEALYELIDDIPADLVRIEVSNDFELLSSSTASDDDSAMIPFYPEPTDFPEHLPKIRRSQLTEIERLGVQADHSTYEPTPGETRHVVFKYYMNEGNIVMFWHEINCTLSIPKHPNIVPFDRNDVKLATFTLYEITTRDLSFREENYPEDLDASMVLQKQDWEQHPDVRLEEGVKVSEYRRVLEDWVNARPF